MKNPKKRKICFVLTSKIHYSRSKLILHELKNLKNVELQIVLGGSTLLDQYGNVEPLMKKDGFTVDARVVMTIGGGTTIAMAKTAGLGAIEFASVIDRLNPDLIVVRGDRYEILPIAMSSSYMNIPVAHIEGGDVTGTIDEHVRHAVTKLSHLHFATSEESKKRLIQLGEDPRFVFTVGAPEIDFVHSNGFVADQKLVNYLGVGDTINLNEPYLMVMQHSVTTEFEDARNQIEETLHAVHEARIPAIWFWPNSDAGTDHISKGIRVFREKYSPSHMRFLKYLPAEQFIGLLKKSSCLVGNSSAGVKECSYLGVPVVNIGSRQAGRYRGDHIVDVPHDRKKILKAIIQQVAVKRFPQDRYFYRPNSSKRIAKILSSVPLYRQKVFRDN